MLTRRSVLFGAAAFALGGFSAIPAYANSSDLLNDILIGITDAVTRNYIREHWREGRWDGHYWWHSGNRYSMDEYRHFLSARARPTPPPPPQPQPRPPREPRRPEPAPVRPGQGPSPFPQGRPPHEGGKLNRPITPQHPIGGMHGPGGPGGPR